MQLALLRLSAVALLLSVCGSASAHRFYWNPASVSYDAAFAFDQQPASMFIVGDLKVNEYDVFQVNTPASLNMIFAVIASQACPDFLPELWVVAKTLRETEKAPFPVPEGYKSLKVNSQWQPYRDYILTARLGPSVNLGGLYETGYYLVIYAGPTGGYYTTIRGGQDTIGGTTAGFDALARFVRCGK